MLTYKVLIIAAFVTAKVSADFPIFINRCSKSDLDLNRCLFKHANLALPSILKGVPDLYLPSLSNFRTGPLDYDATEFIHFHSDDGVAISQNISVQKIRFDPEKNILKFRLRNGYSKWRFDFVANGTILGKPILEKGFSNMTLYNTDFTFEAKLESKTIDGVKHYQLSNYEKANVEFEKFEYKTFDEESINEPMTLRQRKIFNKSLPAIEFSIAETISQLGGKLCVFILNTIFMLVPQEEVFLP